MLVGRWWGLLLSAALFGWSCGDQNAGKGGLDIIDGVPAGGAGDSNSPLSPNKFGSPSGPVDASAGDTTGAPVTSACVGETQRGKELDVDMYIMIDRSGSMKDETGAGPSKWNAMRAALTSFVQDEHSAGFGVGLQYFPLGQSGVPEHCQNDVECGPLGGLCLSKACLPITGDDVVSKVGGCFSDLDCSPDSGGCVPFGTCSGDDQLACFKLGQAGCGLDGDCDLFKGECTDFTSCTVSDYAKPAVSIDVLPDNAERLVASLSAVEPIGSTPTPAALSGALRLASDNANQHPDRRTIVVLATDGSPTECLPTSTTTESQAIAATAKVASQGFAATPSILTYVIGVFAPSQKTAGANLNQLASAGGTGTAFIIDQSQDVTQQLLDAFAKIRTGALPCEFELPEPPAAQSLDFSLVNLELTTLVRTAQTLPYVRSAGLCKSKLGWYYDTDPSTGETPTKITVCPQTCNVLHNEVGASVELRLGCATVGPE